MIRLAATLLVSWWVLATGAQAHEVRPAYLELQERSPGHFSLLWRTPVFSGMRLPIALKLPDSVREVGEPIVAELPGSRVERRVFDAGAGGLAGKRIEFPGLEASITDVLVRIELLDGTRTVTLVRGSQPWIEIAAPAGKISVAGAFLLQGIEHILLGADHLLFVFGLLLIVGNVGMLVKTVTAFTVAHSITLAIATLGYVPLPPLLPLNAAVALSILFLAPEVVRVWRGETSFTIRHPWVVAFLFGLLHGFGFASAIDSAGLPRSELPLALLSFNVGVEIGQLAFVALVLALMGSFRVLEMRWSRWARVLPGYVLGGLGAFWTIQRVALLVGGLR